VSLYSYREPDRIEPLIRAFYAATGIRVKTTFAPQGLIERILGEGKESPADVLLANDFALLLDARNRGITQAFKSGIIAANVPAIYRDPEGHWVGLSQHARLFIVAARRVSSRALTYEDLALPEWKGRLCIRAGRHPYNVGLVASMLAHHGVERTEAWLKAVQSNLTRQPSGSDRDQIRAVIEGACDLAVVNSYYAGSFLSIGQNLGEPKHDTVRVLFPNAEDRGTHVSISGAALMKHSRNRESGIKLVEFLTSAEGQRIYSAINDAYPVNAAVAVPSQIASLPMLRPDSLPLHKIAEFRHGALTLIERAGFDQGPGSVGTVNSGARTRVRFALDWRFEGPSAPFLVALDRGYYDKEGLEVTIDQGKGSIDSIERVADGSHEMGFADINSLIKQIGTGSAVAKAVLIAHNAPPFAIVSLKKSRINNPKDLEGKTLGAPAADGAYAQWPMFVLANSIDVSKVGIKNISFADREVMLAEGKVDAVTGFWFSSLLTLAAQRVPIDDISVMLMTDHGLELYGNAVIAGMGITKSNPGVVAAFVRATIRGIQDTIASPETAVKSVIKRNTAANENVELDRLKMAIARNYITQEVLLNGLGDVDEARLTRAILQIAAVSKFKAIPKPADVFAREFLPAKELRTLDR
jgi:NitT/TauT family transport system substrate-binding protein